MHVTINNEVFTFTRAQWVRDAHPFFPPLHIQLQNTKAHAIVLIFSHETIYSHFCSDYSNDTDKIAQRKIHTHWNMFENLVANELSKKEVQEKIQRPNLEVHHINVMPDDFQNTDFRD